MCVYACALVMCRVSDVRLISVMSETSSSLRCDPCIEVSKIHVPEQGHVGRVFPNFPVMFSVCVTIVISKDGPSWTLFVLFQVVPFMRCRKVRGDNRDLVRVSSANFILAM